MAASHRLGPLGLSDLLDEVIRLYRAGFKSYVAAMAVPLLVLAILLVPVAGAGLTSVAFSGAQTPVIIVAIALGLVAGLGFLVALVLVGGAVTRITADIWLAQPTGVRRGYRVALSYFWRQLGTTLLLGLAEFGLLLVSVPLLVLAVTIGWLIALAAVIVWFASPRLRRPWLKWLIIIATPFGLPWYYGVLWMLAVQAVVLESLGPSAALARSKALVQGEWWRSFGTILLVVVIVSVLQYIPSVPFAILAAVTGLAFRGGSAGVLVVLLQALSNLGSAIGWILFGSIHYIALTLIYFDLRNRKEGYDLQLQAERLAAEGAPSLP
jgi:hypothetical protein